MRGNAGATVIVAGRAARWACALALLTVLNPPLIQASPQPTPLSDEQEEGEGEEEEEPEVAVNLEVEGEKVLRRFRHPASVLQINLEEASAGSTLADVLAQLPGLQLRRLGGIGDPAYAGIRGSSSQQVEVWVDGVPLNPLGTTGVDLSEINLDNYDRIEVWRGFSPPYLGGAPIGGGAPTGKR